MSTTAPTIDSPRVASQDTRSVYRVVNIVATDYRCWEQAAAAGVAELAKSITDLRIARVVKNDVALHEDGTRSYRVKLAVSYRVDRQRVLGDGRITTVRRFLVLADQRAGNESLHRAIAERVSAGAAEFHLVMPVKLLGASAALWGDPISGYALAADDIGRADDEILEEARQRLHDALERIRQAGAAATGEISTRDPHAAALTVLERGSFDEIILSILPHNLSRWLHLDLPHRLAHHTQLPITHIEQ